MRTQQIVGLIYIAIGLAFVVWKREGMFTFTNDFTFYTRWLLAVAMIVLGVFRFRQTPGHRGEQY
jgi:hypothetical protein